MPPFTPDDFVRMITESVAKRMASAPPKPFDVNRVAPNGQARVVRITLPQAIGELTDAIQVNNELQRLNLSTMQALIGVLEENRSVGKQILKQNSRNIKDEDE
jgi:hypothetical protein